VIRNGGTPTRNHQFPIYTSRGKFDAARSRGLIHGISGSAEKSIRSVQPYTSDTPEDTVLYVIQQYDNLDKHQLLLVVTTFAQVGTQVTIGKPGERLQSISGQMVGITGFGAPAPRKITKDGAVIFTIDLVEATPEFEAKADIIPQIAFEKCGLVEFAPVIQTLTGLLQGTIHTVNLFASEF